MSRSARPRPGSRLRRATVAASGALAVGAILVAAWMPHSPVAPSPVSGGLFSTATPGVPPPAVSAVQTAEATPSATAEAAPSPPRVVQAALRSAALGREMPYLAYLPPGYDSSAASYPVLYMLHGYGGGHGEWQYYGLFDAATRLIEQGAIPPMIIVTPEGELGYWMDHADGGPKYGAYLVDDVVSFIDAHYRTKAGRMGRAVGGLSMGADGALNAALHRPGEFGIVGVHSPVLRRKHEAHAFFGNQQHFEANDPLSIVANHGPEVRGAALTLWLDAGEHDPWLPHARALHAALQAAGVPHAWRLHEDGDHGGAYWQAHLEDYLRFYGAAFGG